MSIRGVGITANYLAINTANSGYQTGDASNHTLRVIKDGTAAATANSPAEIDSANVPGMYKIVLTNAEMTADVVCVAGKSSTANVWIIPFITTTEHGILPSSGNPINSNTTTWSGQPILPANSSGMPKVDTMLWSGVPVNPLIGGRVDSNVRATAASLTFELNGAVSGVSNRVTADITHLNASTLPVVKLQNMFNTFVSGVIDSSTFTPTSTVFELNNTTNKDFYSKQGILFTTGQNIGHTANVTTYEYSANSKVKLTVSAATPYTVSSGDVFFVIGRTAV